MAHNRDSIPCKTPEALEVESLHITTRTVHGSIRIYNQILYIMKYLAILFVFCAAAAYAGDTISSAAITYPLEQVLAIADANATQIKIIEAKINAGQAEVEMYRSNARPNIQFGSGVSYVSQSYQTQKMQQAMMLPFFSGGGDQTLTHLINLGLIDTAINADERYYVFRVDSIMNAQSSSFSYPDRINGYSFNWSLSAQQPLITFGKVRHAIRMARTQECTLKDMRRLEKDMFFLQVIQLFSAAYTAQWNVDLGVAALQRAEQRKVRLESEFAAGRTIRRELLRMESMVQAERAKLIASRNVLHTSLQRLLQTINSEDTTGVKLEIDESGSGSQPPAAKGPGSIQLALKRNEAALLKERVKYLRAGFFPSINLVGAINNQFMTIDTNGLIKKFVGSSADAGQLASLAEAFDDANPKPSKYVDPHFFNYSIGLQLNWNIFDGNRSRSQYQQAKYQAQQSLLELKVMGKEQKIALREARDQVTSIDSTIAAVKLQQEAARLALSQTEEDYKDGITDFSTLLDVDKEAREATTTLNSLRIQRVLAIAQLKITMGIPVYGEAK